MFKMVWKNLKQRQNYSKRRKNLLKYRFWTLKISDCKSGSNVVKIAKVLWSFVIQKWLGTSVRTQKHHENCLKYDKKYWICHEN